MFHKEEFFRHETNQKNRFIWDKKSERELLTTFTPNDLL